MPRKRIIFFLLLVPPVVAEMLSGNMPPLLFFQPLVMTLLVLLYGCGTLLIREARRWSMQWSVMFLAIAYGIVEEGLTTKAFFNPAWQGLGGLSGYGMYMGVQWVWAIGVTFYHATVSTLIPLAIADLLWPTWRDKPLLKRRGLILTCAGFVMVVVFGALAFGTAEGKGTIPFHPHPALWFGGLLVVAALVWFSWRMRRHHLRPSAPPLVAPILLGMIAFAAQAFVLIVPPILMNKHVSGGVAVAIELLVVAIVVAMALSQLLHERRTVCHIAAAVIGSLLPYILLTPLHEFKSSFTPAKPGAGMLAVGVAALVLLILWRRTAMHRVRKIGEQAVEAPGQ